MLLPTVEVTTNRHKYLYQISKTLFERMNKSIYKIINSSKDLNTNKIEYYVVTVTNINNVDIVTMN